MDLLWRSTDFMKKVFLSLLLAGTLFSCTKVPISGRRQLNLLPNSFLNEMALTQYRQFLGEHKPMASSEKDVEMVRRVGQKISAAVTQFLKQNKQSKRIEGFKWEFNVVNESTVNAWCMPGGKVVVYTGLLPVTQTETALAIVMGHEIAHAVARHGNERMSQGLAVQGIQIGADIVIAMKNPQVVNVFNQAYGLGTGLGMLKYSRVHESEADKLGLVFAAMAGYDPRESIPFWERMAKSGGPKAPEILSTHPSDETRIKDLKAFMPKAMKYYKPVS